MLLIMLQLRDLPSPEILDKFASRYPQADTSAIATFLHLLRVATDLARLRNTRAKPEAHAMLLSVYGEFTEGFDTRDLTLAADLLASLQHEK